MCMLFSEKSDQLRIILGNCRTVFLWDSSEVSPRVLSVFNMAAEPIFKSLNKTFHEKCRMFRLTSGHCTPLIKMRNKPEFGVFSLQPSPRWGVGWAAIVYKKLCSIKLVIGKNLIKHEKKNKTIPFFAIIGFSLRKIKRTHYSYKLPPFLSKKPRKKPVSIKLGRCYPQNRSDMGIPFSYYLSELG